MADQQRGGSTRTVGDDRTRKRCDLADVQAGVGRLILEDVDVGGENGLGPRFEFFPTQS